MTPNIHERELFYDRFAEEFDAYMNPYDMQRRIDIVLEMLSAYAPKTSPARVRVLDGGAGTGRISKPMVDAGYDVVSMDIGTRLLHEVRKKTPANLVTGSAVSLPFQDGSFDVVMSSEVIEHTPDPRLAVFEYTRVLREGGLLILTCPNRAWFWSLQMANLLGIRRYDGLENWPTFGELEQWAGEAGLTQESHFGFHLFPFQIPGATLVLKSLDHTFRIFGPFMINQCIVAQK
jgi:2-polyprenyl-3-methyl-5-hydroxy-6-metoxy-1,4-benzoquinol methylase